MPLLKKQVFLRLGFHGMILFSSIRSRADHNVPGNKKRQIEKWDVSLKHMQTSAKNTRCLAANDCRQQILKSIANTSSTRCPANTPKG
jgi:hypothetical protein